MEIELKLALSPSDIPKLRAVANQAGKPGGRRLLTNIYFDTPTRELARAGFALRLRKSGGRWVQTLKGGPEGAGGLHARGEWEFPQRSPCVDLALFAGTPLATLDDPPGLHRRLAPAFTVAFHRQTWTVEPEPGTRLELALDQGSVTAGDGTEPVCEVEIEVLEGNPQAAFALARTLLATVAMRPSVVTKAERGYRIAAGVLLRPRHAAPVRLDATLGPQAAARAVIAACLEHLQRNEEGILATEDPGFVHQARVALRRLRSALRVFAPVMPPEALAWRRDLGAVARALGKARDWDVIALETLPPIVQAHGDPGLARTLAAGAQSRRAREREGVRPVLLSAAYARLILDVAQWLSREPTAIPGDQDVAQFASRILRKRHRKLLAAAANLAGLSPEERHAVRVEGKRLRYAAEDFTSLFKPRQARDYLDALAALQEVLGESNDARTAVSLLGELTPTPAFAEFARGWLASRTRGDPKRPAELVDTLAGARRFWLKKAREAAPAKPA